jgi:hypothetical protein
LGNTFLRFEKKQLMPLNPPLTKRDYLSPPFGKGRSGAGKEMKKWGQIFILDFAKTTGVIHKKVGGFQMHA